MRIDAAVWLGCLPGDPAEYTPDTLWRILNRNKFEGAVASALSDAGDTPRLLQLAAGLPWLLGVVGCGEGIGPQELDAWSSAGKLCGVWMRPEAATSEWLAELAGRSLALDLVVDTPHLDQVVRTAGSAPDLRIAVANMAQPDWGRDFDDWAQGMHRIAAMPNVMVKMSGFLQDAAEGAWKAETYRPYIQHLMREFGPGRLVYGSDWPKCSRTGTWKQALAAFTQALGAQTMETREQILGENARRCYALGAERTV